MHRFGIETGADLKEKTLDFLVEHFGKPGPYFYGIARGIDIARSSRTGSGNQSALKTHSLRTSIPMNLCAGRTSAINRESLGILRCQ